MSKTNLKQLKTILKKHADSVRAITVRKFFKNSKDDIFLGVNAASIRKIAKDFYDLKLLDILELMKSNIHEERSVANAILCLRFKKGNDIEQEKIFRFYLKNKKYIRDWDAVDDSAPYIVGPYLLSRDKAVLYQLARSKRLWDRRIAIVATLHFIRQHHIIDTLKIAEILLQDQEDLIHKAVGWALREVGKRDLLAFKKFLKRYHLIMPRTTLRYAIERFPAEERKEYLIRSKTTK